MRVALWHGWLLDGSGSNVYSARVTDQLRRQGHDVLLLCQERHPERYPYFDAWGTVSETGVSGLVERGTEPGPGRAVLLRPEIGDLLPVFVIDEYEGFEVKLFVELTDDELERYLARNVAALRAAIEWSGADAVTPMRCGASRRRMTRTFPIRTPRRVWTSSPGRTGRSLRTSGSSSRRRACTCSCRRWRSRALRPASSSGSARSGSGSMRWCCR